MASKTYLLHLKGIISKTLIIKTDMTMTQEAHFLTFHFPVLMRIFLIVAGR